MHKSILTLSAVVIALGGCAATFPDGPSVAVMPAPGKPFEVFTAEDNLCREFARQSIGSSANDAATNTQVRNAVLGTALGAAAGALIGGQDGAGVGAAFGMVAGTAGGAGEGTRSGMNMQTRYDIAYQQCMYAKGNQLPGNVQSNRMFTPPPSTNIPPPPPGSPPPPPPGYR